MKNLETLAREVFDRFAKNSGSKADWNYLSEERKLAWMQDVLLISEYFLNDVKSQLKPIPFNQKFSTVYETAYNEGLRSERVAFTTLVEDVHKKLLDEYEDFEYSVSRSKKNSQ